MPPATVHPLTVIRRARDEFGVRRVMVAVSCGKDATVALSLARQHFDEVLAYFMYFVPGLSFQERYLCYLERRFDLTIERLPHWGLSRVLKSGRWRLPTRSSQAVQRKITISDVENLLRQKHSVDWFVTGEKCIDSLERNAMIKRANGVDPKRGRIWPLAYWTHGAVFNHLKSHNIALPPDYSNALSSAAMGSFSSLALSDVLWVRNRFPEDYRKIVAMFPLVPAMVTRHEQQQKLAEKKANGQEEAR